jgi:endonuclease YncB( thermonuclease family)
MLRAILYAGSVLIREWWAGLRAGVLVLFFMCCLHSAWADVLTGRVVRVVDGDTVHVLDNVKNLHKIRLAGIDAPESSQAFGRVSRSHLADLVAGKTVTVEWHKRDRYRRIVGKILLDGKDMNLEQVSAGLAWHFKKYSSEQSADDRDRYAKAETVAREEHLGLWRDSHPIPPWDYRRTKAVH